MFFVFFKQKTAFDVRISDWSSDVCSSDLIAGDFIVERLGLARRLRIEFGEVQPGAARGVRQMIAQMPVMRAAPNQLTGLVREGEAIDAPPRRMPNTGEWNCGREGKMWIILETLGGRQYKNKKQTP